MIEIFTAAAVVLAWFVFRYDRHGRRRDAIEAAHGLLRAVHHGMVQGLTPGQTVGWGQLYFVHEYTEQTATARAGLTRNAVMQRSIDQVFVVPTEPLAKLATSTPQEGLIDSTTVAVANFALWRVRVFNQLVWQLTDFNTRHAVEILSEATDDARRTELAAAAGSLSTLVHKDGIGRAWSQLPGGGRGWYGALVEAIGANMTALLVKRGSPRWQQVLEWPYSAGDLLVLGGFAAVIVSVVR